MSRVSSRLPQRRLLRLLLLPALLFAAPAATAEELRLGAQLQYVYDSNFLTAPTDEEEANSFLFGPVVGVSDPDGRFRYDVDFVGGYQAFVDQDDVDAWESRLSARLTYDLDSLTRVQVTNRFRDISNLRFSRQDIELTDSILDPNQDRFFRNDLELALIRDLTRFIEVRALVGHQWIDFEDNVDRNDSQSFEVGSEVRYRIAPRTQVGVGVNYAYQDFEKALSRLGSTADYVNGFLSWNWQASDEISLAVTGGPSWVRSKDKNTNSVRQDRFVGGRFEGRTARADFDSCNPTGNPPRGLASNCDFNTAGADPIPASDLGPTESFELIGGESVGSDTELTFFGSASILASLTEWSFQLSYNRRQSSTTGDALASVIDRVALDVEYDPPSTRWALFAAGSWDRRENLTEATVVDFVVREASDGSARRVDAFTEVEDQEGRFENYTAILGARYGLSRSVDATLEFRYRRTEQQNRGITFDDVDSYFVVLTLNYSHDPIRFGFASRFE